MLAQLFDHPDVLERLRKDRSLISKALTESMRMEPVAAYLARLAARDMELSGVTIRKGTAVSLSVAAANRDETDYDNPDVLNIDRPLRPVIRFGFGAPISIGMHIARVEKETAMEGLL